MDILLKKELKQFLKKSTQQSKITKKSPQKSKFTKKRIKKGNFAQKSEFNEEEEKKILLH